MAVAVAGSCSSDLTPGLETSICCRCTSKKKKKNVWDRNVGVNLILFSIMYEIVDCSHLSGLSYLHSSFFFNIIYGGIFIKIRIILKLEGTSEVSHPVVSVMLILFLPYSANTKNSKFISIINDTVLEIIYDSLCIEGKLSGCYGYTQKNWKNKQR